MPVDEYEVETLVAALGLAAERGAELGARRSSTSAASTTSGGRRTRTCARSRPRRAARRSPTRCSSRVAEAAAEVGLDDTTVLAERLREIGIAP